MRDYSLRLSELAVPHFTVGETEILIIQLGKGRCWAQEAGGTCHSHILLGWAQPITWLVLGPWPVATDSGAGHDLGSLALGPRV